MKTGNWSGLKITEYSCISYDVNQYQKRKSWWITWSSKIEHLGWSEWALQDSTWTDQNGFDKI